MCIRIKHAYQLAISLFGPAIGDVYFEVSAKFCTCVVSACKYLCRNLLKYDLQNLYISCLLMKQIKLFSLQFFPFLCVPHRER